MDTTTNVDAIALAATQALVAPLVIAIVQGAKAGGMVGSRWAMPFACLVGILANALVAGTDLIADYHLKDDVALVGLAGIITGLVASGLYSGVQRVAGSA